MQGVLQNFIEKIKAYFKRYLHIIHRGNITQREINSDQAALNALPHNPYLQSKVLWNDLYGSLQVKLENSYRIIFILSIVIALAIVGFMIVAGESKVQPYVTVIHGDDIVTLNPSTTEELHALYPKLSLFFAKNFIQYARSVSADSAVNAHNRIASYALVSGAATERLKEFYRQHSPDVIARLVMKEIHITSVLRTSAQSIEIRWREDDYAVQNGKCQKSTYFIAQMVYQFGKISEDSHILRVNPLGFTITQLSWSEDHAEEEIAHEE